MKPINDFLRKHPWLLKSSRLSQIAFLVIVGAIVLLIISKDPPDNPANGSSANPFVPEIPIVVNSPSAMPDLSPEPSVGLVVRTNIALEKDYFFEDDKHEILVSIRSNNVVLDCQGHMISGKAKYALEGHSVRDVTIKNCNFSGPFQGATFWDIERITIRDSVFVSQMNGLHIIDAAGFEVVNSQMTPKQIPSKGYAIEIKRSMEARFEKNKIEGFDQGILLYDTSLFKAIGNQISNITETGIGTFQMAPDRYVHHGLIEKNDIRKCLMGLEIHTGSHDIDIRDNVLANNGMAVRMDDEHGTPRFGRVYNIHFLRNRFFGNKDQNEYVLKDLSTITGI